MNKYDVYVQVDKTTDIIEEATANTFDEAINIVRQRLNTERKPTSMWVYDVKRVYDRE